MPPAPCTPGFLNPTSSTPFAHWVASDKKGIYGGCGSLIDSQWANDPERCFRWDTVQQKATEK